MRLLLIHSKPFSYKCVTPAKFAEEPSEGVPAQARVDDALVVMVAVEKRDGKTPDRAVGRAAIEVEKSLASTGAKKVVLYPYALLSNSLPSPDVELAVIKKFRDALSHCALVSCPFGWQRSYQLNAAGGQGGEFGRVIEFDESEITKSVDRGREHAAVKVAEGMREALLDMGFDEVVLPGVLEAGLVRSMYGEHFELGAEGAWRVAAAERVKMTLDGDRKKLVAGLAPGFSDFEALGRAMRRYMDGEGGAGELAAEAAALLKYPPERAAEVAGKIFPELMDAGSARGEDFLRHEAAPAWAGALRRASLRGGLPVKFFASGPRFRAGVTEHPFRSAESTSVSFVIMARDMSLDAAKKPVSELLKRIGLDNLSYRRRRVSRPYFDGDSDTGIFIQRGDEYIKIGSIGFYSRDTLDAQGISGVKVFCADFGVERIALALGGGEDIRSLEWPPGGGPIAMDDGEIAAALGPKLSPESPELRELAITLAGAALDKKDLLGPSEVKLYEGPFAGRTVALTVFNWDAGRPLLSLAAGNSFYVLRGNVYGLPRDSSAMGDKYAEVYSGGVNSGLRFMDLLMLGFTAEVEDRAGNPRPGLVERRWKIAKHPEDINLSIPAEVADYIRRTRKTVKAGGPLFFGLKAEIK